MSAIVKPAGLLLLATLACSFPHSARPVMGDMLNNATVTMPGSLWRASAVACEDFREHLKQYESDNNEVATHLANIENYAVEIEGLSGGYIVRATPKPIAGIFVMGGGAEYVINRDYSISKRTFFK